MHADQLNTQLLEAGHVNTLDKLKEKRERENIPQGIHKICYENHLVYAPFILDSQIGLRTVSSVSIAKDLSFIIHIEGKLLQLSKVSHLVKNDKITDACSLTNILAYAGNFKNVGNFKNLP